MQVLKLQQELKNLGLDSFTVNDVAKITGQDKEIINVFLHRQVERGILNRIKKGHYSFDNLNKFQLASTYKNSYLGLHSALEFYGTTTQRFLSIDLIGEKQLQSTKNTLHHKVKEELFFGYEKVELDGIWFFVSNLEKTLIDCVYFSNKVYLSEIREFIRQKKEELDIDRTRDYLNKINSSTLNKRVSYLLSLEGIKIEDLKINGKYEKLNKNLSEKGIKDKTWKLIINEDL